VQTLYAGAFQERADHSVRCDVEDARRAVAGEGIGERGRDIVFAAFCGVA